MRHFSIKQWLFALGAVVVVGIGVSAPVLAQSFVQASEGFSSVPADKTVDGAAFIAGDTVTIDGTIKGDLFCAGNTVTINGVVEGDVLCGGNSVTVGGTVNGDIRVGGNTIILKGTVKGSASVAGNSIIADSSFSLGTDLTAGGNSISLSGVFGRDVRAGASQLTVNGTVGRHLDSAVNVLTVAEGAKVGGNLTYTSDREGSVATGTVAGSTRREQPTTGSEMVSPRTTFAAFMALLLLVTLLFVVFALFVALVAPRYVRETTGSYDAPRSYLKAAVVGIATFFIVLPVVLIAFISGVGIPIGFFILTAYSLALMLSGVLAAYRLGVFMVGGRTPNVFATMVIGAIALAVLVMIPYVGFLVLLAAGSIGLGMVVLGLAPQYEGHPYSGELLTVPAPVTKRPVAKKKKP